MSLKALLISVQQENKEIRALNKSRLARIEADILEIREMVQKKAITKVNKMNAELQNFEQTTDSNVDHAQQQIYHM